MVTVDAVHVKVRIHIKRNYLIGILTDSNYLTYIIAGYFTDSFNANQCTPCPINTYSESIGSEYCTTCGTFRTNQYEGSVDCPRFYLNTSSFTYYSMTSFITVLFLLCLSFAGENAYIMFMLSFFPILDIVTDMIYILSVTFWNFNLFISAIAFFVFPSSLFVYKMAKLGALPRVKPFILTEILQCELIWLSVNSNGYPLINGQRSSLSLNEHDGVDKLLLYWLLWFLLLVTQLVFIILAAIWYTFGSLFLVVWVFIGMLLFQTKMLAIGKVWNTYFYYLTQSDDFSKTVELDASVLNESLFYEFMLETVPQICIQCVNNSLTFNGRYSSLSLFSLSISVFIAFNGVYRYGYYLLWKRVKFDEIPLPLAVRLKVIKQAVRRPSIVTRNISVLLQNISVNKKVAPDVSHIKRVRGIIQSKKIFTPKVNKSLSTIIAISEHLNQLEQLGVTYEDYVDGEQGAGGHQEDITKLVRQVNEKCSIIMTGLAGRNPATVVPIVGSNPHSNIDSSPSSDDSSSSDNSSDEELQAENDDTDYINKNDSIHDASHHLNDDGVTCSNGSSPVMKASNALSIAPFQYTMQDSIEDMNDSSNSVVSMDIEEGVDKEDSILPAESVPPLVQHPVLSVNPPPINTTLTSIGYAAHDEYSNRFTSRRARSNEIISIISQNSQIIGPTTSSLESNNTNPSKTMSTRISDDDRVLMPTRRANEIISIVVHDHQQGTGSVVAAVNPSVSLDFDDFDDGFDEDFDDLAVITTKNAGKTQATSTKTVSEKAALPVGGKHSTTIGKPYDRETRKASTSALFQWK